MATLGGATFVWNGIKQDYHFIETLQCLHDLCDEVAIMYGGDDGTVEAVDEWSYSKDVFKPIHGARITQEEWDAQVGREKLSFFSNLAIEMLHSEGMDYVCYIQSDEVMQESCFTKVREAIDTGAQSFMITRHNLWATPFNKLNVEQSRKPCSTEVIRIAKSNYRCVDDAESIGVDYCSTLFLDDIVLYHTGFVRDKYKHLVKIKHMQEEVFLWTVDKRIHDNIDGFQPWKWGFTPADVLPITEPLPKYIQQWAKEREYDPFQKEDYDLAVNWLNSLGVMYKVNKEYFPKVLISHANDLWWKLSKQHQIKSPE